MARIKGPRKIHRYTAEFKVKAVKLSELKGVQVQDVADALDIHPFMLSRWRKEVREGRLRARVAVAPQARERGRVEQLSALKRQRRPRIRSGRSLCSLGSPLNAYPLGRSRR
jgi:transposase